MEDFYKITLGNDAAEREGVRAHPFYCPIAVAIRSQVKGVDDVSVTGQVAYLSPEGQDWLDGRVTYTLPPAAQEFIRVFDDRGWAGAYKFLPLTFIITREGSTRNPEQGAGSKVADSVSCADGSCDSICH